MDGSGARDLLLGSVYLPYDQEGPPPTMEVRALVAHAGGRKRDLLLGRDANAHHNVWGSTGINRRANTIDFIEAGPSVTDSSDIAEQVAAQNLLQQVTADSEILDHSRVISLDEALAKVLPNLRQGYNSVDAVIDRIVNDYPIEKGTDEDSSEDEITLSPVTGQYLTTFTFSDQNTGIKANVYEF
ncbi:hypothetical protein QE152_g22660 [Popillia japonica]|uniref:Uncharacterized protein n=1 Tax=Popillia japonica TaxID=7064 RepID=A0AAW1KJG2_POPJA